MRLSIVFEYLERLLPFQATFIILMLVSPYSAADSNALHIRTLASSCAICHGTHGNSVGGTPVLAGLDPNHFIRQMLAFRSDEFAFTIMHHHASGLTRQEIDQLADYFAKQPRIQASMPEPG